MSDITEGLGTALEGGLIAGALESEEPGGSVQLKKGHFSEQRCLNCGTDLNGPYCRNCGQKAHLHRTIGAFLHDLMHGALHFDGKTWRTLPMLAFKPGQLTRRYIEGERARFVSPMALFLFSIFLMFAIFQMAGISTPSSIEPTEETVDSIEKAGSTARNEAAETRTQLEERLVELPQDSALRAEVEADLENLDTAQ